jgi:hypothetical protein
MKVFSFSNALGIRKIYGVEAPNLNEAIKLKIVNNFYYVDITTMRSIVAHFMSWRNKYSSINEPTNLIKCLRPVGTAKEEYSAFLDVKQDRSVVDLKYFSEEAEATNIKGFLIPFMLVFQGVDQLSDSKEAVEEGYTSPKDQADLKYKRLITLSWSKDPGVQVTKKWAEYFGVLPMSIEKKPYKNVCGGCKNLLRKLSDGCKYSPHQKGCMMGINTTPENVPSWYCGVYKEGTDSVPVAELVVT